MLKFKGLVSQRYRRPWSAWKPVGIMMLALAVLGPVHADEATPDKFKIAIGGYGLTRYDTDISLTEAGSGLGLAIRPEDTLGVEKEQAVFRLDGHYRFNERHALSFSWYRIGSNGTKSMETEIDWIDQDGNPIVIPVGASVETALDYDIYKLGYLWTFYNSEKVELMAGAGLHITRIRVGLEAETTSTGIDARRVNTTVPLPVLSFGLTYNVTPKFDWYVKSELFTLKYDDWDGVYTDLTLGMEYSFTDHFSAGLGIGSNALQVTEDTSDYRFEFNNRIVGLLFYVAAKF
jgi:hypothetical protein